MFRISWFRVVLDEAQTIKNHRTQTARAAWAIKSLRRWCLSGTPMQNSVDDLFSYFRFLKQEPYSEYPSFRSLIRDPIAKTPDLGFKRLQTILQVSRVSGVELALRVQLVASYGLACGR